MVARLLRQLPAQRRALGQERLRPQDTGGIDGLCLEVHDLAISKYVAGQPKDVAFTSALARHGLTHKRTLLERAARTRLTTAVRTLVRDRIGRDFAATQR